MRNYVYALNSNAEQIDRRELLRELRAIRVELEHFLAALLHVQHVALTINS